MIKGKLTQKIGLAFSGKLSDAIHIFSCTKEIKSGEFDYKTQTYPIVVVKTYSGRGVLFGSYLKDMVKPTDYQAEDCKAVVLQAEVIGGVPEIGDVWITGKGHFEIINIGADPTDTIWTVQLRKVVKNG